MRYRKGFVAGLAGLVLLVSALPAAAAETRSGTRNCGGSTPFGQLSATSSTSGFYLRAPGASSLVFYSGTSGTNNASVTGGGTWSGQTTGTGTFRPITPGCVSFG